MERFLEATQPDEALNRFATEFASHNQGQLLLDGVFGNSPFLTQCMIREPGILLKLVETGPNAYLKEVLDQVKGLPQRELDEAGLMRELRIAKRRVAVTTALCDLTGIWSLPQVTGALSDLADFSLDACISHVLRRLHASGEITLSHPDDACRDSGFVILAMGKHGSRELNYSSDIDLIVLYDLARLNPTDPEAIRQSCVRATRDIMRLMESRTADGYVFRTDLRLRPDPGATPLAMSVGAAETYYESLGQNWERAAMIKARPAAGDKALGQDFLAHIKPFIWRKHLDFAAINDIHSIKRQINAHRGSRQIAVNEHDIKIGRGGIREIEFFAQTQQLIWGGRLPALRLRRTCETIEALNQVGQVSDTALRDMVASYHYLRKLEHRLQMIDDKQTQKLPKSDEDVDNIARFMGYQSPEDFRTDLLEHLGRVESHYARLFEDEPDLGGGGSLVFTGMEDDPDTVVTLQNMGFREASRVSGIIRAWHHGRYRATRSERARQILTELMPQILTSLADTANPDEAFINFDTFLSGLPAGVQLFSMFNANPKLLNLVAELMGNAPRLSRQLARRPELLDSMITPGFLKAELSPENLNLALGTVLSEAADYQDVLDGTRRWSNDTKFKVGVQLLDGTLNGETVGPILSSLAETLLCHLVPRVEQEFAESHGVIPGGGLAIIAFGKLGGGELLPGSDLDLVYIYDGGQEEASDGEKALMPTVYNIRLCQRIGTAVTSQTGEGRLYDIDNRLRPAGNAGALATQLQGFESYYDLANGGDAWTWEHMALTRARAVYGPDHLCQHLQDAIHRLLIQKRDANRILIDVAAMRERIARQYPGNSLWSIKYQPGGLVDIEFTAQTLQLIHAHKHPEVLSPNTARALEKMHKAGLISAVDFKRLREALGLWRCLQAVLRLTVDKDFDETRAPLGQKQALMRAARADSFNHLKEMVQETADAAREVFERLILSPAAQAADGQEE
ncbi:glutamate-ammonia-ligase adenylyltransferase [Aestuariispira insulae]|uniref:Bifunctional glutamine synthetase adenylyltransferase/adenylyl-removing enzyme n=2 Tax=Aestuariispira insulae TaxID=1461337 RepID=A0A3D9HW55_9PROT|nr:glutamate-ammonia-ligase adenylyltransferase [Aestuariispira insulae]